MFKLPRPLEPREAHVKYCTLKLRKALQKTTTSRKRRVQNLTTTTTRKRVNWANKQHQHPPTILYLLQKRQVKEPKPSWHSGSSSVSRWVACTMWARFVGTGGPMWEPCRGRSFRPWKSGEVGSGKKGPLGAWHSLTTQWKNCGSPQKVQLLIGSGSWYSSLERSTLCPIAATVFANVSDRLPPQSLGNLSCGEPCFSQWKQHSTQQTVPCLFFFPQAGVKSGDLSRRGGQVGQRFPWAAQAVRGRGTLLG